MLVVVVSAEFLVRPSQRVHETTTTLPTHTHTHTHTHTNMRITHSTHNHFKPRFLFSFDFPHHTLHRYVKGGFGIGWGMGNFGRTKQNARARERGGERERDHAVWLWRRGVCGTGVVCGWWCSCSCSPLGALWSTTHHCIPLLKRQRHQHAPSPNTAQYYAGTLPPKNYDFVAILDPTEALPKLGNFLCQHFKGDLFPGEVKGCVPLPTRIKSLENVVGR